MATVISITSRSDRQPVTSRKLLTPGEVARAFKIHPKSVTRWAIQGRLSYVRTPGGHRRYFEDEVRGLLNDGRP